MKEKYPFVVHLGDKRQIVLGKRLEVFTCGRKLLGIKWCNRKDGSKYLYRCKDWYYYFDMH